MRFNLKIISSQLLTHYTEQAPSDLQQVFDVLQDAELSTENFNFYTSVASVFSSKIEGEEIELDSYVKYKRFDIEFLPDYTRKIDDLYNAYTFAQSNELTEENIFAAHRLLAQHLVPAKHLGAYRTQNMFVTTPDGKIEYIAALPGEVRSEMQKLFYDIQSLLSTDLRIEEVFFFASYIHLLFVKIHPWTDGNGRSARLIEKWFLARKLGTKAWFVQSEKHYYQQHETYYRNIRRLGIEYEKLDYAGSLPFLFMPPHSLFSADNTR